ncbi:TrmB family transcriptional regulator [Pseudoleptotrichia goodfellowii]|uniref:Sugar-specific transcriptional regulator, TrmB family n=2 Tax=Pseudoleptotrichia goodfellowii TaxID=157692 RepID=D0GNV3_9FUSO|nr:TrmB family transcriptional regulator [Pseudoleptotrichia goodfellowii]EEY34260.1 sugar-specific transcriptional regulator, TrmB family [Pseudoleptotrichia goodfellowii F0264]MBF4805071.1 TrmB family transcriptional regulator [Pseudoleptotrichia goodfellowii]BBM36737.1 sugar-specific transcriptional regulator, TrmB family [Pseudoleptotrichia goodfellowii]
MDIISELQKFGFSKVEAEVYMEVLNVPMSNGTQISKKTDISRSAIYNALERLCEKGYIYTVPTEEDKKNYMATEPMEIISKLKEEWQNKAEFLEKEFLKIRNKTGETRFYELYSEESLILKIKEMILNASDEVYISTNIDIYLFREEILKMVKAGIKIFIFNYGEMIVDFNKEVSESGNIFENYNVYNLKIYNAYNKFFKKEEKEIIMVSDIVKGFSCEEAGEGFVGMSTENKILVKVLAENIHNNIYVNKIERVYGEEVFEETFIESVFEKKK